MKKQLQIILFAGMVALPGLVNAADANMGPGTGIDLASGLDAMRKSRDALGVAGSAMGAGASQQGIENLISGVGAAASDNVMQNIFGGIAQMASPWSRFKRGVWNVGQSALAGGQQMLSYVDPRQVSFNADVKLINLLSQLQGDESTSANIIRTIGRNYQFLPPYLRVGLVSALMAALATGSVLAIKTVYDTYFGPKEASVEITETVQ